MDLRSQITRLLTQAQQFPGTFIDVPYARLIALIASLEEIARQRMCNEFVSFPDISVEQLFCGNDFN